MKSLYFLNSPIWCVLLVNADALWWILEMTYAREATEMIRNRFERNFMHFWQKLGSSINPTPPVDSEVKHLYMVVVCYGVWLAVRSSYPLTQFQYNDFIFFI